MKTINSFLTVKDSFRRLYPNLISTGCTEKLSCIRNLVALETIRHTKSGAVGNRIVNNSDPKLFLIEVTEDPSKRGQYSYSGMGCVTISVLKIGSSTLEAGM